MRQNREGNQSRVQRERQKAEHQRAESRKTETLVALTAEDPQNKESITSESSKHCKDGNAEVGVRNGNQEHQNNRKQKAEKAKTR